MKDYNMENAFIATPLSSKLIHVQLLIDFVAGGNIRVRARSNFVT